MPKPPWAHLGQEADSDLVSPAARVADHITGVRHLAARKPVRMGVASPVGSDSP
jgi:hypothetical protein